jgi:signal transduction histidine kinase
MLILPNYVLFYSLNQVILFLPGFILIHIVAIQINRILKGGGKYAILQSNFLIVLIGYLPFIESIIVRSFFDLGEANFPFAIVGISYPLGYFVYMRFIQIVQPRAVAAITNDEIYASSALKSAVTKIVEDEFEQSMSHQWATYIHGKILTRLAATSLKLEQAVSNNDVEGFELCLKNLRGILENPTSEFGIVILPLNEEIASRLDPWEGLISIAVDIDPELTTISNERVRDLGEVIEEVISNSVRHGGSQNITIRITRDAHPDIYVHIEDDAVNPLPIGQSRVGLGTKILNLVTDGRWSISHIDGKTTVDLTMSLLEKRI